MLLYRMARKIFGGTLLPRSFASQKMEWLRATPRLFRPAPTHWLRENYVDDRTKLHEERETEDARNESASPELCANEGHSAVPLGDVAPSRPPDPQTPCDSDAVAVLRKQLAARDAKVARLGELLQASSSRVLLLEAQVSASAARADAVRVADCAKSLPHRHAVLPQEQAGTRALQDSVSALQDRVWLLEEKLAAKEAEILAQGAELLRERAESKALGESLMTMQQIMKRRVLALERELKIRDEQLAGRAAPKDLSSRADETTSSSTTAANGAPVDRETPHEDHACRNEARHPREAAASTLGPHSRPPSSPGESTEAFHRILKMNLERGDWESILEWMQLHRDHAAFQVEACCALATVAHAGGSEIARKAFVQRILAAMERHTTNGAVQAAGCAALKVLSSEDENARGIIESGISAIVAALDAHSDAEVAEQAVGALLVLCSVDGENQQRVKDALGPERLKRVIPLVSCGLQEQLRSKLLASSI